MEAAEPAEELGAQSEGAGAGCGGSARSALTARPCRQSPWDGCLYIVLFSTFLLWNLSYGRRDLSLRVRHPGAFENLSCQLMVSLCFLNLKLLSRVRLFATPWTVAYQVSPSMGFSRQEY